MHSSPWPVLNHAREWPVFKCTVTIVLANQVWVRAIARRDIENPAKGPLEESLRRDQSTSATLITAKCQNWVATRRLIAAWHKEYSHHRSHNPLRYRTLAEFAVRGDVGMRGRARPKSERKSSASFFRIDGNQVDVVLVHRQVKCQISVFFERDLSRFCHTAAGRAKFFQNVVRE